MEEYLEIFCRYSMEDYFANFGEIEQQFNELAAYLAECDRETAEPVLAELTENIASYPEWMKIHVLSFCMKMRGTPESVAELLDAVIAADDNAVGEYNKLSHYWQICSYVFTNGNAESPGVSEKLARLYMLLEGRFQNALGIRERKYIPLEQRDRNLVFVFSGQFLGMNHAPTKTLLDRCYVLQKYLHKKVYIVNTAMFMPMKGQAPFFQLETGNYVENLCNLSRGAYKDQVFDFFQCENRMPDLEIMNALLKKVRELRPYCLVHIGGNDICADLCGMLVPQITISTVFSKIPTSCGEYQIVDRALREEDLRVLEILGVQDKNVKRTMFTFSFKDQSNQYSRQELGLWEDRFILTVIGWRLDVEITAEFLEMLCQVVSGGAKIGIAFIGMFESYEKWIAKYPLLAQNSRNLGTQSDVLAVLECCDLYVNPRRNGGGSSVAEALFKGLPAVTLPVGDVSVAAGEEFWVQDYAEMEKKILHYAAEPDYYQKMSESAKCRAELLMDSERSFGETMKEIEAELEQREAKA